MPYVLRNNGRCLISTRFSFASVTTRGEGRSCWAIDEDGYLWSWGHNVGGAAGQGNYEIIDYTDFNKPEFWSIPRPQLCYTNTGALKSDWVGVQVGELSAMAIDAEGRLWCCGQTSRSSETTGNCAAFGLPHDSGTDDEAWQDGVDPRTNEQVYFFNLTRAVPGMTPKAFTHCYYFTHMIGQDDLLYIVGEAQGYGGTGMLTAVSGDFWETPTRVSAVTDTIELLAASGDMGYGGAGVVTQDGKILAWGEDLYYFENDYYVDGQYVICNITDNIPTSSPIVQFCLSFNVMLVLLANGEIWGRGPEELLGYGYGDESNNSYDQWVQIQNLPSSIVYIGVSQSVPWALDSSGNLYTWGGYGYYETGDAVATNKSDCDADYFDTPTIATGRKWLAVNYCMYFTIWHGVDSNGQLMTWGSNYPEAQLGNNTYYNWMPAGAAEYWDAEEETQFHQCAPQLCTYDAGEESIGGLSPFTANFLPVYPEPIEETHDPCGHWHKVDVFFPEELPRNCWQPAIDIDGNNVLYVASGKFPDYEGGGYDLVFAKYNSSYNEWETLYLNTLVNSADYVGQAAIAGEVYGFFNYKQDVTWAADIGYTYATPDFGCWILYDGTMQRTSFSGVADHGKGNMALTSAGVVAVMYTDSGGITYVKVSTDYGATWSTVRTLAANADRDEYGILFNYAGDLWIAYMTAADTIKIEQSQDNGATWTVMNSSFVVGTIDALNVINSFVFKNSSTAFFLGFKDKFYYSTDECATFTEVTKANLVTVMDGFQSSIYAVGLVTATDRDDYALARYDADESAWTEVLSATELSGTLFANDKATMAQSNGTFVYTENNFAMESKIFQGLKILISTNEGQNWSEIPSPFAYYASYQELANRWPLPTWPFTKDSSFRADNKAFTIVEQQNKWGYMSHPFYKNFNL